LRNFSGHFSLETDERDAVTCMMSKSLRPAIMLIGFAMVLYHMVSTQYLVASSYEHQSIHLAFLLVLVFLDTLAKKGKSWLWIGQIVLVVLSVIATAYVFVNLTHLEEVVGLPEPLDVVIGVILIVLVIEGTRQAWGLVLPIVTLISLVYLFWGHLIQGAFHHKEFAFDYAISILSVGLSGIYGSFLSLSANEVFLFVVFGSLMELIKLDDFFNEAGKVLGRVLEGGPGQTAVVSSALVGMVSGASVANVVITGSFTIPYMKRVGYRPEVAGAIEATASTGGQIMPPVMGAAAFLMAFYLGVPYATIMIAGFFPAFLYYFCVALGVQFLAASQGLALTKEHANMRLILRRLPLFLIPLTIIVILLLFRYSPMLSAFWAILSAVALSWLSKETRPSFSYLVNCLAKGAVVGAKIGISLTIVGMVAQIMIVTDLGIKLTGLVQSLSGGNLIIALIITMIVSLILGCGVPTTAAYAIVAIVAVPTLIRMGAVPLSAHFFCFYFAIISALTPPVALCSLAASGIAGASYLKTSWQAFKLAISGFLIPFLIMLNPLMLLHESNVPQAFLSLIAIVVGLSVFTSFIYNYGLVKFTPLDRFISFGAFLLLFGYSSTIGYLYGTRISYAMLMVGMALFAILLYRQIQKMRARQAGHLSPD
jgi:TRAP transporter 4TM/12TM fusion protein